MTNQWPHPNCQTAALRQGWGVFGEKMKEYSFKKILVS